MEDEEGMAVVFGSAPFVLLAAEKDRQYVNSLATAMQGTHTTTAAQSLRYSMPRHATYVAMPLSQR